MDSNFSNQGIEKIKPIKVNRSPDQPDRPESGIELNIADQSESETVLNETVAQPSISTNQTADLTELSQSDMAQVKKIEGVLEDGLSEMFLAMKPIEQQRFKKAGEKAAREINTLLKQAKVNIKKIVSIISNWLKLIPGVNRFFLEQEAKIKTDEIIKLKSDL